MNGCRCLKVMLSFSLQVRYLYCGRNSGTWGLPRYLIQKLTASGSLKERKAIQPLLKLGQKKSKIMHSKAAHDNNAQNQLSKTNKGTKRSDWYKKERLPADHFRIPINRNVGSGFVIVWSKMAIGRSKPGVKAMPQGMELRLVAQVPRKDY